MRELGELDGVDVVVDPAQLDGISDDDAAAIGKVAKQNLKVLRDYASRPARPGHRRIVLRFLTSPIEIKGDGKVESIVVGRNDLVSDASGRMMAKDTGAREELPAQLVVRAVGYRGLPTLACRLTPIAPPSPQWRSSRGQQQRIRRWLDQAWTDRRNRNEQERLLDTVDTLLEDLAHQPANPAADQNRGDALAEWLNSCQPQLIAAAHWEAIDNFEREAGQSQQRPRVKVASLPELLRIGHG